METPQNPPWLIWKKLALFPKELVKSKMSRRKCFKSTVQLHHRIKEAYGAKQSIAANKKLTKKSAKKQISSKTPNQVYACLVCGGCENEDWIQCHKCQEWAHEECADLTDARFYYCDNCV